MRVKWRLAVILFGRRIEGFCAVSGVVRGWRVLAGWGGVVVRGRVYSPP